MPTLKTLQTIISPASNPTNDSEQVGQQPPDTDEEDGTRDDVAEPVVKPERWSGLSGGVQFLPWLVADKMEQNDDLSKLRDQFSSAEGRWYW